jgi:hypothetical protein
MKKAYTETSVDSTHGFGGGYMMSVCRTLSSNVLYAVVQSLARLEVPIYWCITYVRNHLRGDVSTRKVSCVNA